LRPVENGLVEFAPGFMGPKPLGFGSRGFVSGRPLSGNVPGGFPLGVVRKEGMEPPGIVGVGIGGLEPGVPWPGGVCDGLLGFPEGVLVPELLPPEFELPELVPEDGEAPNAELAPLEEGVVPEES